MIPTKTWALPLCAGLLLGICSQVHADTDYGYYSDDQLQAPNVSYYAMLQTNYNNLNALGGDQETGFSLLAGAYFNDIKVHGLRYGVELGYNSMGETDSRYSRALTPTEAAAAGAVSGTLSNLNTVRLSSLSFGGRLENKHFFFRFGGAIYNLYSSTQRVVNYVYNPPSSGPGTPPGPANSDSSSNLAPYLGVGLHAPLAHHLNLVTGYDLYLLSGKRVGSIHLGLQYAD